MRHPLDREIASPFSQQVAKRIQRERQLGHDLRDSQRARLQIVSGYNPRLFVADPDMGQPEVGDEARPNAVERAEPLPTWHWHGRNGRKG